MTKPIPYVRKRDGVFQYERRVPLRIQNDPARYADAFGSRPLFRRSLRTKSRGVGFAYEAAHAEFERLIAEPGRAVVQPVETLPTPTRIVTDDDLAAIVDRYRILYAQLFEALHSLANVNDEAAAELDRLQYQQELDAETIASTLKSRQDDDSGSIIHPATEARWIVADRGFYAPEGSAQLGAIIAAVRTGMEQGYERIGALGSGRATPTLPVVTAADNGHSNLTLADAVDRYLDVRQPPSKAVSETKLALKQFEECVGRKSLRAITRDDFHTFTVYLADHKVGGKTAGSIVRHLSEHTIRKRLRMLGAAITNAIDRGWVKGPNPASDIKVSRFVKIADKAKMPEKRRLQVDELNAIFAHPWFIGCRSVTDTHTPGDYRLAGSEYWAPVVAAYTGCRVAELGGLKVSEVRLDHPFPHLIIRDNEYRRTKSKKTRCVPILDALMALGFGDYVESIVRGDHDRIFPDWTAQKRYGGGKGDFPAWSNARLIRAFNRTVIPASLGDRLPADARREVTFHSFRGSFKAMLGTTNKVPTNIVHEVVGHKKPELDERYIGEVTIEETYPEIKSCDYKGLIIPKLFTA